MSLRFPQGFRGAGLHSGVKRNPQKEDLSFVVSDHPAVGVGVYTRNLVCAAPVELDRSRTPSNSIRAVVINSGVANACTGERGDRDAREMARLAACAFGVQEEETLVLSTGVIGTHLPLDKIAAGINQIVLQLGDDEGSLIKAARGMMTTDTVPKLRGREVIIEGLPIRVTGIAKGAAMIGPNMATMLSLIMTDANIGLADAQTSLSEAVVESFNCISVDGHTSTNDTVLLLANGAAGGPVLVGRPFDTFRTTLFEVCEDLAQSIPADGEGATHLITVEVHGTRTREEAVQIAKTISDSPLVKTAIAGADPNWGRIVSAAGYAGVQFDPRQISLHINGLLVYERGAPASFDEAAVSASIRDNRDTHLVLLLDEGTAAARFWTTDLTVEYVRLNADYHT